MPEHLTSPTQVDRDVVEYGRISGWAVAALLLGFLSGAALVGPLLWAIPVLGIVVAWIGMRNIKASAGQLSGWHLALLGLLLSVFFGIAGPARTVTRRYVLEQR